MEKPGSEPVKNRQIERPSARSVGDLPAKDPQVTPVWQSANTKSDDFWPLSGKPYFTLVLSKTHAKPGFQLVLPTKMQRVLPSSFVPVVLTCCGKDWMIDYLGDRPQKRFSQNWKTFVIDNDLKAGDACVFEVMECSSTIIKFRVQILKGDFPPELVERVNGETADSPIVLD
ncbi:hypothetical protein U1Q18_023159 [Sarracenia purpurea var. burkii]